MRLPWNKSKPVQLDLLDMPARADDPAHAPLLPETVAGEPLLLPLGKLCEDPHNPRTEFPETDIDELAEDIRQRGILQPIVVHPADERGCHRIHFGAKRWRAAKRAGLTEVPVVVRAGPADPYAQVAENQKRHGLSPIDMARFIQWRVEAGESNATIAKRLGMNLTTVAHHLTLLDLPPELDKALRSGRCTSPRTLHELKRLHADQPEWVDALVVGAKPISRDAVAALKAKRHDLSRAPSNGPASGPLVARAFAACDRLEATLARIQPPASDADCPTDLVTLKRRIDGLAERWLRGSDRQTPSQAER